MPHLQTIIFSFAAIPSGLLSLHEAYFGLLAARQHATHDAKRDALFAASFALFTIGFVAVAMSGRLVTVMPLFLLASGMNSLSLKLFHPKHRPPGQPSVVVPQWLRRKSRPPR